MSREEYLEKQVEYLQKIVDLQDKLIEEIQGHNHIISDLDIRKGSPWDFNRIEYELANEDVIDQDFHD